LRPAASEDRIVAVSILFMKLSPRVYTLAETAEVLHIHPITVRRLIKRRILSRVTAIRDIRIPVEDVDRLLNSPPHQ